MKEKKKTLGLGVHSLPEEQWPAADRAAWQEARRPSVRLQRGGTASHLRPVVQHDLRKRHGLLDFVARSERLDMNAPAGAQVTPENVGAYVAELKNRVSSVTVYGSIQKLRRFVQLIAPGGDLRWLIEIERQLYSEKRPRPKWDRVVTTDVLVDAGRTLMAEAEITKRPKLSRARMFRNGLMVALLAYCPIRLKNFAALEIGRSFVNVDGTWWIVLTAAETKEKRADERPAPQELTASIERYLEISRPILAGGKSRGQRSLVCHQRQTDELRVDGRTHRGNHKDDDWHRRQSSSLQDRRSDDLGDPRRRPTSRWERPLASRTLRSSGELQSSVLYNGRKIARRDQSGVSPTVVHSCVAPPTAQRRRSLKLTAETDAFQLVYGESLSGRKLSEQ